MIGVAADTRDLAEYRKALGLYLQLNRRDATEIVRRKGNDLRIALYRSFRAYAPAKGAPLSEARARDWRVRRRGAVGGLSAAAKKRADVRMGGNDSILVSSITENEGRIILRGARASKKGNRRILGGRSGMGGTAVSGRNALLRKPGDKVLNRRAIEVIEEINLRDKGRGASAVGWLAGRVALRKNALGQRVREIVRNRTGTQTGGMDYRADASEVSVTFSNRMTAARAVATKGAIGNAVRAATADLRVYIERKVKGTLQESGVAR
jgi:hypothetical protein